MNKLGTIARPRPLLLSGTYWRSTSSAVEHRIDFMSFGIDLGRGGLSVPGWAMEWRMSNERLLSVRDYDLGSHVYGRSGRISVRAPYVGPPRSATGAPTQAGTGSVGLSRPTQRRSLLRGIGVWTTPPAETEGAGISSIWAAQTGIVDVTVQSSPNSPGYRIHGRGLYGPTGYWITKDRPGLRIGQILKLEWGATDFECPTISYSVTVGGVAFSSGAMASGSVASCLFPCNEVGIFQVAVVLSDANGKTVTLTGPLLQAQDAPVLPGAILLPVMNGRYRVGADVLVRIQYAACVAWAVVHEFQGAQTEIGRGSLSIPGQATTEFLLPAPALGTHHLDLILYDSFGAQDPASEVDFYVIERDQLISS